MARRTLADCGRGVIKEWHVVRSRTKSDNLRARSATRSAAALHPLHPPNVKNRFSRRRHAVATSTSIIFLCRAFPLVLSLEKKFEYLSVPYRPIAECSSTQTEYKRLDKMCSPHRGSRSRSGLIVTDTGLTRAIVNSRKYWSMFIQ